MLVQLVRFGSWCQNCECSTQRIVGLVSLVIKNTDWDCLNVLNASMVLMASCHMTMETGETKQREHSRKTCWNDVSEVLCHHERMWGFGTCGDWRRNMEAQLAAPGLAGKWLLKWLCVCTDNGCTDYHSCWCRQSRWPKHNQLRRWTEWMVAAVASMVAMGKSCQSAQHGWDSVTTCLCLVCAPAGTGTCKVIQVPACNAVYVMRVTVCKKYKTCFELDIVTV